MIHRTRKGGSRRGPWRSEAKRRWIAAQPCVITFREAQCCHVFTGGMRQKCSDEFTIPLSPELHDQFDGRRKLPNGQTGKAAFQDFYVIDLLQNARMLHAQWEAETGKRAA